MTGQTTDLSLSPVTIYVFMERYTGLKYESELIQEYLAVNYGVRRNGP
jgi:hypothetical protein